MNTLRLPAALVCRLAAAALPALLPAIAGADGLPVTAPARTEPVRFQDEILPILAANCTACHNPKIHEGGLILDSHKALVTGGDSGPGVVAGKAAESPLFLRSAHLQEDFMPPADNKVGAKTLSPERSAARRSACAPWPVRPRPLRRSSAR